MRTYEHLLADDPYYEAFRLLMRTRAIAYRVRARDLEELGVSPEQAGIMWLISESPEPVTPTKIAKLFFREPHTIAVNLKRMRDQGLVSLQKDAVWKNRICVRLTDQGTDILNKSLTTEMFEELFNVFSSAEFKHLNESLERLLESGLKILRAKAKPKF